jgi:hypothetical protein
VKFINEGSSFVHGEIAKGLTISQRLNFSAGLAENVYPELARLAQSALSRYVVIYQIFFSIKKLK